jgi:hypothetical protein
MGMAPLVVLIANNLSCVLNGTTSKDAGIIQVSVCVCVCVWGGLWFSSLFFLHSLLPCIYNSLYMIHNLFFYKKLNSNSNFKKSKSKTSIPPTHNSRCLYIEFVIGLEPCLGVSPLYELQPARPHRYRSPIKTHVSVLVLERESCLLLWCESIVSLLWCGSFYGVLVVWTDC